MTKKQTPYEKLVAENEPRYLGYKVFNNGVGLNIFVPLDDFEFKGKHISHGDWVVFDFAIGSKWRPLSFNDIREGVPPDGLIREVARYSKEVVIDISGSFTLSAPKV